MKELKVLTSCNAIRWGVAGGSKKVVEHLCTIVCVCCFAESRLQLLQYLLHRLRGFCAHIRLPAWFLRIYTLETAAQVGCSCCPDHGLLLCAWV